MGPALIVMGLLLGAQRAEGVEKACDFCHPRGDFVSGRLSAEEPGLCLACHPDRDGSGEHPTGGMPAFTGSARLPLKENRIVCTTCHDPHSGNPMMLRIPPGQLCTVCHQK